MKVGILGGSFNPAHLGHLHISNEAIKKLHLNQVWWLINYNPFKEKSDYKSYEERFKAAQKIAANNKKIKVKNLFSECDFTYDLVKKLKKKYPKIQFYFVMGADNLARFHEWNNFSKLINLIEFDIFSRNEYLKKALSYKALQLYNAKKKYSRNKMLPKISLNRTKNFDISSTEIRAKK